MLIDIKSLKLQLKTSEKFSLQEKLPDELLSDLEGCFVEPCQVELTVERNGNFYFGKGIVTTKLQLHCSRCLKEIFYPVNTELNFSLVESIYENEFSQEETEIIFFHDTQVDITPIVQETVLLNLPIRMLCQENCQGLCSECGVDKNLEECKCQTKHIDPRWEKLKDLQTGKEV